MIPIHLPSLHERSEDLPDLAEYFLEKFCRKLRKNILNLSRPAVDLMRAYSWPGNIRELENILERAVTLAPSGHTVLTPDLLPVEIRNIQASAETPSAEGESVGKDASRAVIF